MQRLQNKAKYLWIERNSRKTYKKSIYKTAIQTTFCCYCNDLLSQYTIYQYAIE